MTHVVTSGCFECKSLKCIEVCPCESFREGESMLFIDPESCIDCQACAAECPNGAIFFDEDVPEDEHGFVELNAEMAATSPVIVA